MTDLVIYYSRTNNTKIASQTIANKINGNIEEIKDNKDRKGWIKYLIGAYDAIKQNETNISYNKLNLKEYNTVYIGTPVWASKPAPAINQFIKENDFTDVNVITFATMGSSGGESTTKIMNDVITKKGGKIIKSFAIAVKNEDIEKLTLDAISD